MKKVKNWIGVLLVLFSLFGWFHEDVHAEEAGYHYEDIHVNVQINDQREYRITETMEIEFEESMHGIVRDIPKSGDAESYAIRDVNVTGMPFEVEENQREVNVKIGDKDTLVEGRKTVVLSYTLKHYQDYDSQNDYVYLNLLGTDYDCEVRNFRADITFPSSDRLLDHKVTSGYGGSMSNAYTKETMGNGTMHVESVKTLPARHGVTLQLKYEEGVFANASAYPFPYIIDDNKVHVRVNEEQDFVVEQVVTITSQQSYSTITLPMIQREWNRDNYRVDDIVCDEDVHKGKDSFTIYAHGKGQRTFTLKYTIHPYQLMNDTMRLTFFDGDEDTRMDKFSLQLELPYEPDVKDYRVQLGRGQGDHDDQGYQLYAEGNSIYVNGTQRVLSGAQFYMVTTLPDGEFHRETSSIVKMACMISAIFVALMAVLRFVIFRRKDLVIPVNFYPPEGMNPAEAGYVIDMNLSDTDMTSLIFYWADKGYLHIRNVEKQFQLVKIKEPDAQVPAYERRLFDAMFAHGYDGIVEKKDLVNVFYKDIRVAKRDLLSYYTRERTLRSKTVESLRMLCLVLSFLPVIAVNTMNHYAIYGDMVSAVMSNISFMMIMLLMMLFMNMIKKYQNGAIAKVALIMILIVYGFFGGVMLVPFILFTGGINQYVMAALAMTIVSVFITYGIHKDSAYRNELLSSLMGFKEFIKTAEIERLEMMLKDDPEYYYHVLPYAQVLHVSDIWEDKFRSITIEAPTWYDSTDVFYYASFHQFMHHTYLDMSSASRVPASSGGGSGGSGGGFSGGGGGFSGGGHSGGGSGGGGSHGW